MNRSDISKQARIDESVVVGPYSIIEDDVEIGANTIIGSYVIVKSGTSIGRNNIIYSGAQIGVDPQDYHFKGERSQCRIGDNNVIREYATISRATGLNAKTIIGDDNYIMTYVHIAHNIRIGDNTVIASNTQIGGHCEIGDFVNIGGLTGVHQFCRIGRFSMLGAKSYLNKDLAPYLLARGNRARIYGLNVRGLRRNRFSWQEIEIIKNVYRHIEESPLDLGQCLGMLKPGNDNDLISEIMRFFETTRRGVLLRKEDQTVVNQ